MPLIDEKEVRRIIGQIQETQKTPFFAKIQRLHEIGKRENSHHVEWMTIESFHRKDVLQDSEISCDRKYVSIHLASFGVTYLVNGEANNKKEGEKGAELR